MNVILVKKVLMYIGFASSLCVEEKWETFTDNSRLCAENTQQNGFQLTFFKIIAELIDGYKQFLLLRSTLRTKPLQLYITFFCLILIKFIPDCYRFIPDPLKMGPSNCNGYKGLLTVNPGTQNYPVTGTVLTTVFLTKCLQVTKYWVTVCTDKIVVSSKFN